MASTAEDQARLLVSIEATQAKYVKQMEAVARASAKAAKQAEDAFRGANDNIARSTDNGAKRAAASVGQTRAAVANLSFQLNDIAMGLASGTSPFTIMVQQGSQVAQALQGAGGGLVGAVKALGGAFASMVNPVSLASFALIGLGGAAVQYFMTLKSDAPDANELLKRHAELIRSFDEAYGIAEKGAKKYSEAVKAIELQKLRDQFGDLKSALQDVGKDLAGDVLGISESSFEGATKSVGDFGDALKLLERDIPDVRGFALAMQAIEAQTGLPENVRKLAGELRRSAMESVPLQDALEEAQRRVGVLRLNGEEAVKTFSTLTSTLVGLGAEGGVAVETVAKKFTNDLVPAVATAITQLGDYIKNYQALQKMIERSPLGTLSPLVSGGGQFLNPDQFNTFRADEANLRAAGETMAAAMIKRFESFSGSAYADTRTSTGKFDAWRAGFGSDTVTRANGMIEKVTKETVVSLDDAERDLSRRILEFQSGIQNAIGVDTWRSLSEGQQAALTSIAYNYGSLPKKIVEAIQSGGGPQVVASAIASLTANPDRRREEAQSYLSGTGISMSEAGLGGRKSRTPADTFKGSMEDVQRRIDLLNAEYEAQARVNPLVNDYGYAVEKARIQQDLLNKAQEAGITVTPELAAKIESLATNMAKASSGTEQLKDKQQRLANQAAEIKDIGREAVGGLISDLMHGRNAADALSDALGRVADRLLDMVLDGLFSGGGLFGGGGGGGGLLGGMIIPGILHKGGVAGKDGYGHGRAVSSSVFSGASRYHKGGVAGLQPGEIPAILQRGEVVLPKGAQAAAQGVHVTVGVSADSSGNLMPFVESVTQAGIRRAAPGIVTAAAKSVRQNMPSMMSEVQSRSF